MKIENTFSKIVMFLSIIALFLLIRIPSGETIIELITVNMGNIKTQKIMGHPLEVLLCTFFFFIIYVLMAKIYKDKKVKFYKWYRLISGLLMIVTLTTAMLFK